MTERWNICSPVSFEQHGEEKTKWLRHGVMFRNKSGNGFNLFLESMPLKVEQDGRVKLMALEDDDSNVTRRSVDTKQYNLDDDVPF
jgi:hypothetical protein